MNDQENIKRIRSEEKREEEWESIRKEMEAGSGATGVNVSTVFKPEASILQELRKELQIQRDALAGFAKQDWDDQAEYVTQGWCEALEFAIKLIDNKGSKADQ
mgnify:CR=1 FL=1